MISGKSGFILIGLVLTMIVFAALVAAIVPMFSSATQNQISANMDQKAFYMAESGFRYAASQYIHTPAGGETRDDTLTNLSGKTFTLSGQNSGFTINISSFFYKNASNSLVATPFGSSMPTELQNIVGILSGKLASYNGNAYDLKTYTGYTTTTNRITFSGGSTDLGMLNSRVFPYAPLSTTYSGSTMPSVLTLNTASDLSLFPTKGGSFRIMNSSGSHKYPDYYAYKTLDPNSGILSGITKLSGTTTSITLVAGDNVLLQRFIRIASQGTAGNVASNISATRTLTYNIPVEALSGGGGGGNYSPNQTPLDNAMLAMDPSGNPLGVWQLIPSADGGGGALNPVNQDSGQGHYEALLPTPLTESFADAWSHQGKFLSYQAQVKIATGTLNPSTKVIEYPPGYYGVGLSFRDQETTPGQWLGYILTFMRAAGNVSDGIPASIVPTGQANNPIIALTKRDGNNNDGVLAYATIPATDLVLEGVAPPPSWPTGGTGTGGRYKMGDQVTHNNNYYKYIYNTESVPDTTNEPGIMESPPTTWILGKTPIYNVGDKVTSLINPSVYYISTAKPAYPPGNLTSIYDEPDNSVVAPLWNNKATYTQYISFVQNGAIQYQCISSTCSSKQPGQPNTGTHWQVYYWTSFWLPYTLQAGNSWPTYWEKISPPTNTVTLRKWDTLVVDIEEAYSINFASDPGILVGQTVTNGSSTISGVVIDKIYDLSGNIVYLLNKIVGTGTFDAVNGVLVAGYSLRDNYIRAYYADQNDVARTVNTTSLDGSSFRAKYSRGTELIWPTKNPTETNDLFTIAQWTIANSGGGDGAIMQDKIRNSSGTDALYPTIIRTSLFTTKDTAKGAYFGNAGAADNPLELGLISLGNDITASKAFFDDFSYRILDQSQNSGSTVGFLPGNVAQ